MASGSDPWQAWWGSSGTVDSPPPPPPPPSLDVRRPRLGYGRVAGGSTDPWLTASTPPSPAATIAS
jgi:hypothetical protein